VGVNLGRSTQGELTLNPKPRVLDPNPRGLVIVVVRRVSSKLTDFVPPPPSSTTPPHDSTHPRDSLSVVRHSYESYGSRTGGYKGVRLTPTTRFQSYESVRDASAAWRADSGAVSDCSDLVGSDRPASQIFRSILALIR
jgi:hypothetical protein